VTGSQRESSAERGQIWIERIVGFAAAFVKHYDTVTADAEWTRQPAR
jgi:hypothetical protein